MAYILHIETTSTVCSVALSHHHNLIDCIESNNGFSHAENLHVFIESILQKNSISQKDLNAISISTGPGSYTGLRIGYSAAKGIAYALNIPLIEVDTLAAMAQYAFSLNTISQYACPFIDARRMEVYTAIYKRDLSCVLNTQAIILDSNSTKAFNDYSDIIFLGDGVPKAKELLKDIPNSSFIETIMPSAKYMITITYQKYLEKEFSDIAYSEPNYVKDFHFQTASK